MNKKKYTYSLSIILLLTVVAMLINKKTSIGRNKVVSANEVERTNRFGAGDKTDVNKSLEDLPDLNKEKDFNKDSTVSINNKKVQGLARLDFSKSYLYKTTKSKLDESPESYAVAHWVGIGDILAGDEVQDVFLDSVDELNKNPEKSLVKIVELVNGLETSENHIRGLAYAAVSHLNISLDKKRDFYSKEIYSSFLNVDNLDNNAEMLGLGLTYFSQTNPDEELLKKTYETQIALIKNTKELKRVKLYWQENFKNIKF